MKFVVPEKKKLVFEMSIPIRWGDMDAFGHVNNGSYFRYLESVRIEWMHSIGAKPDPKGHGPVTISTFCNFYRQMEYPGNVLAKLYASDPGRTTFEGWCTMSHSSNPEIVCAEGGATTIWADFPSQKSVALPDWLREIVTC